MDVLNGSKLVAIGINWGRHNILLCACYHSARQWFRDPIFSRSPKTALSMGGLVISHSYVSQLVVGLLITYLATIWRHPHFGVAAVVTNVQDGVSVILVIVLAHISDRYIGHFKMIIFTNIAYTLGLVLLAVSWFMSPDIAARVFYGAAVLITLGEAGRSASLEEFFSDQCIRERMEKQYNSDTRDAAEKLWKRFWFSGTLLSLVFSTCDWATIFIISAIKIAVFLFVFWLGRASYLMNTKNKDPTSNNAGIRILCLDYLQEPRPELYTVKDVIPHQQAEEARGEGSQNSTENEEYLYPAERVRVNNFWTLRKLKEEKLFFMTILPWCPAFLVYSVVEASVSTFFIEQTDNWNVSVRTILLIINSRSLSSFIIPYLYRLLVPKHGRDDTVIQIGCGLTCSVLCSIAAWRVEIYRISSIKDGSNISVYWLLPQFCLAGFMHWLAVEGLNGFVLDQVAEDNTLLRRYAPHIVEAPLGIGKLMTCLIILVSRQNWFRGDMKTSRLDKYYRFLTILSFVNFMCHACAAIYFCANGGDGSQSNIVDDDKVAEVVPTNPLSLI